MAIVCESCRTPVWVDENGILMTLPKYCIDGVDQINCLPYSPGDYHDTPMEA